MTFLLQTNNPEMKTELFLWRDLLEEPTCPHDIAECSYEELEQYVTTHDIKQVVPMGSIAFTNLFFKLAYNIEKMNPVEIPPCLLDSKFLGRNYRITYKEEVPTEGYYFIKDASSFKEMAYLGNIQNLNREELKEGCPYVISEPLEIMAEYRVYFLRGEVYAIEYYNGNPLCFPDRSIIMSANMRYAREKDYPKSYTMDVMVTRDGTFLTEIHPVLFSCGLYTTVLGTDFLNGYIDGLHYILRHNTPVSTT
ncbi:MAG: ATP-grasp domain-containing protein [Bacteroidaceae bacterium]|nr:ATP-grasp domain-containing protein [Bacteroidaceae bacterium]